MKIGPNREIIFEEITCFYCDGKKQVTQYNLCPLNWQPVNKYPGRECPHCKAKNKNKHETIGEYQIACPRCEGTGLLMENGDARKTKEIVYVIPVVIIRGGPMRNALENLSGVGICGGCTDYGSMRNFCMSHTDEETVEEIRKEMLQTLSRPVREVLNKDNKLCDRIEAVIRANDYSLYPIWE